MYNSGFWSCNKLFQRYYTGIVLERTLKCDSLYLSWVWTRTFPPRTWGCAQFLDAPCWGWYHHILSHF